MRHHIAETGRYYHGLRTIVIRAGLLIEQERRVLWHELAHAERCDTADDCTLADERIVDHHAAQDAMPWESVRWAWHEATDLEEMAGLLKLPQEFVRLRLERLHPAQRALLRTSERDLTC